MPFAYALKVYCTLGTAFSRPKPRLQRAFRPLSSHVRAFAGGRFRNRQFSRSLTRVRRAPASVAVSSDRRKHESRIGGGRPASHLGVWNRRHRSQRCSGRCGSEVVDPGVGCRASAVRTNLPPPAPRLHPAGRPGRQGRLPPLSARLRALVALTPSGRACPSAPRLIQHASSSERTDWAAWADPDSHAVSGPRTRA
jgi:hypothetical protein